MSTHELPQPVPGQHLTDRQLAAIDRVAQMGYLNPAAVQMLIAEVRRHRAARPEAGHGHLATVQASDLELLLPRIEQQITLTSDERSAIRRLRAAAFSASAAQL